MPDNGLPDALKRRLDETAARHAALQASMNDPAVLNDSRRLIAASREAGQLAPVVTLYADYAKTAASVADLHQMRADRSSPDAAEMADLADAELPDAVARVASLGEQLTDAFVAAADEASGVDSFFVEIRAGTGGEEAALFARDLYGMYELLAQRHRWAFAVSDFSESERGGFKEVIIHVKGAGAFRRLQFEGGGHRVQRVPETEAQGRIHTSAATVAVLPELEDVKVEIDPKDVEEQGCRGGGPGGQNVNKVETGWRITHKPTGLQFKMTEHKSQAQNKERAWALLRATLYEQQRAKQHAEQTASRRSMMGSGDRSQRVRTYNFPQNRCTDHRLGGEGGGEKNFNLEAVLAGDLDPVIDALLELDKRQRLEML